MALPTIDSNIIGTHIYPLTDLAMASSIPNATAVNATAFTTGLPGTVVVLAQLSSGTQTINIRVDDTAAHALANIGSPTATLSLAATGTKYYQTVDTANNATTQMQDYNPSDPRFVAASSTLWVQLQQVAASSGSIMSQFLVLVLFELIGGEDWYSIRAGGFNAVGGCTGISGVTPSSPTGYQDGAGNLFLTSM